VHFKTSDMDVVVKYKPIGNELMVPKPVIKMKTVDGLEVTSVRVVEDRRFVKDNKDLKAEITLVDPETGTTVPTAEALEILEHYKYRLLDTKGQVVEEDSVEYYEVKPDGTETLTRPFDRTSVIEVKEEHWVPSTAQDDFMVTNIYEIYSDDKEVQRKLYEEAEKRLKADQIGITTFSFGNGFIQYYALLIPVVIGTQFVWLMKLTDTKVAFNHLQEAPVKVKLPIREAPPPQALPPIQVLVAATKKKKEG
jgi:hypothetical protein